MSRYIEMSITLPTEVAQELLGKTDPFGDNVGIFPEQGGVAVVVPHATGPYGQVVSTAVAEVRGLLDSLIEGDVEVPIPWRVMALDRDLMEQNLIVAHDLQPKPTPEEGQ